MRVERLIVHLVPVLAALALYGVTLGYDLTYDDLAHMERPGVTEHRTWKEVWTQPTLFYRPAVTATFRAESRGGWPLWERHGVNVILNAAVTLLVVRLALVLGLGTWMAGAVGLLFAVHPAHVEAVAGIVGRADLLAALFLLGALLLHDRALRRGRAGLWTLAGMAGLAFLGASSKETAWGLPAFALVLHLARRRSVRPLLPAFAAYAIGILGHLVPRHHVLGGWLAAPSKVIPLNNNPLGGVTGLERLVDGLRVGGMNLLHLVFPATLAPDYSDSQIDLSGGPGDPKLWCGILLVLGSVLAVLLGRRLRPREGRAALVTGGGWLLISAFMVMNLVFTIDTILGDRLLYWPSVAWVLMLGGGLTALGARAARGSEAARAAVSRVVPVSLLLVLAVAYTARAADYVPAWKDNVKLFQEATRAAPRAARSWYNLGWALHWEGRLEEAVASYRKARELVPGYQAAWTEEAAGEMALGHWDTGAALLRTALRLDPEDPLAMVNWGVSRMHADSLEAAALWFRKALDRDSTRADAWYNLGLVSADLGRDAEAETAYRHCLELRPGDAEVMAKLGDLLATRLQRPEEGEALARRAAELDPRDAYYKATVAECLYRQGKRDEALTWIRDALALGEEPYLQERLRRYEGTTGP